MIDFHRPTRIVRPRLVASMASAALLALLLAAAGPAQALYKVVGPDGKITYTDRPDTGNQSGKVMPLNPETGSTNAAPLPLELRQVAARYPVSLYVGNNCQPCDAARSYLNQRGVPFAERLVVTTDDTVALEKLTGAREAPTLAIGAQIVRGFAQDVWASYLDAAGYPRESRLPATWQQPAPTPLVARQTAAPPEATQRLEPTSSGIPVEEAPNPSGIRF